MGESSIWENAEMVFIYRPRCPACSGVGHRTLRSDADADGSVTRRTLCRTCGCKFKVIVETEDPEE